MTTATISGKEARAKDENDAATFSGKNSGNISVQTGLTATSPARVQPAILADSPQTPAARQEFRQYSGNDSGNDWSTPQSP